MNRDPKKLWYNPRLYREPKNSLASYNAAPPTKAVNKGNSINIKAILLMYIVGFLTGFMVHIYYF
ncbi:hypothetical protein RHO13_13225 (plasmid) [Orbus wheelerorum]|uniref:hypothetical protein n=1 Tax=Orbus wheelerorum TaxID=3074111 RepID=UPI00370DBEF8